MNSVMQDDSPVKSFFNGVETETFALFNHPSFEFLWNSTCSPLFARSEYETTNRRDKA